MITMVTNHLQVMGWSTNQWLFLVPLKGGRWHIIPQLAVYTTYIPLIYCLLGGKKCYRSHLLGEPETTIELSIDWIYSSTPPHSRMLITTRMMSRLFPSSTMGPSKFDPSPICPIWAMNRAGPNGCLRGLVGDDILPSYIGNIWEYNKPI